MKERPILFSGPMVRALLAGTKTQTRRVVKWRGLEPGLNLQFSGLSVERSGSNFVLTSATRTSHEYRSIPQPCPYGQPGDRLWVRETFCLEHSVEADQPPPFNDGRPIKHRNEDDCNEFDPLWLQPHYKATDPTPELCYEDAPTDDPMVRWKPSIHMPRWASRITLEITGVRVERLQDISEADARAEGIETNAAWPGGFYRNYTLPEHGDVRALPPRDSYRSLWQSINGRESWDANPWVWVVEFRVMKPGEVNQQGATR